MLGISLLQGLLLIWVGVMIIALALIFYRSILGGREADQICLSQGDSMQEREQEEVLKKAKRIAPFLYVSVTASVVLLLSVVGVWLYQRLLMM